VRPGLAVTERLQRAASPDKLKLAASSAGWPAVIRSAAIVGALFVERRKSDYHGRCGRRDHKFSALPSDRHLHQADPRRSRYLSVLWRVQVDARCSPGSIRSRVEWRAVSEWRHSSLWDVLSRKRAPDATEVREGLSAILRKAEMVLAKGATQPASFTLHDEDHAFRVAERIAELAGAEVLSELTHYEVGLLLAAAYLHDIGMVPSGDLLNRLRRYCLDEDHGLGADVVEALLEWKDFHPDTVALPVPANFAHRTEVAEQVVAAFARDRHNDWSQRWIEAEAPNALGQYAQWRLDLVRLCRSHHEGYAELTSAPLDGRLVGGQGTLVNLRYLAMLLRIADVLEVDPERTPRIILEHRVVDPASVKFWEKDHYMSLQIRDQRSIFVHSRPPSAVLHRAVSETLDGIDAELAVCRRLAVEGFASKVPTGQATQYHWRYEASVVRDLKEGGGYRYIDGAFRPDTRRLLELLGGIELYKDPVIAVRELVQNAFDAVREEVAWTRIQRPGHFATPTALDSLAATHSVELEVITSDPHPRLICRDSGVGMTESILRDYFLVSGSASRPDATRLERLAHHAGFSVGRTGRFGIGVLSYFMLAQRVVISTQRSPMPGDGEAHGWTFETFGIGSFGELRRKPLGVGGSEVVLYLRPDESRNFATILIARLTEWAAKTPCRLVVSVDGVPMIDTGPGFAFTPRQHRGSHIETAAEWKVDEGALPDALGTYRLDIPMWRVGDALAFIPLSVRWLGPDLLVQHQVYYEAPSSLAAWRGMTLRVAGSGRFGDRSSVTEHLRATRHGLRCAGSVINFESEACGGIGVDRSSMYLSEDGERAVRFVEQRQRAVGREFATRDTQAPWNLLNRRVVDAPPPANLASWQWLVDIVDANTGVWDQMRFPVLHDDSSPVIAGEEVVFRGRQLATLKAINIAGPSERGELTWHGDEWMPDTVASFRGRPVGLFTSPPTESARLASLDRPAFPPEWTSVAGFTFTRKVRYWSRWFTALNSENGLVKRSYYDGSWDPRARRLSALKGHLSHLNDDSLIPQCQEDPRLLASWLVLRLESEDASIQVRAAKTPEWWAGIWDCIDLGATATVLYWVGGSNRSGLHILDRESWRFQEARPAPDTTADLPPTGIGWTVCPVSSDG
jgi:hypothetical protein